MKLLCVLVFSLIIFDNVWAQPDTLWTRTYGGDGDQHGTVVISTQDNGFAMAGGTENDDGDFLLILTDEAGDELWSKTYDFDGNEFCTAIIQIDDGGFVLGGITWQGEESEYVLLRTDAAGEEIWSHTYGRYEINECYALAETDSGAYVLAGSTITEGYEHANFYAVKVDSTGETLWEWTYNRDYKQYCYGIAPAAYDAFMLIGYSVNIDDDYNQRCDPFIVKVAQSGRAFFQYKFPTDSWDLCTGIVKSNGGGYTISGFSVADQGSDFFLMSITDDMEVLWRQDYQMDGYEYSQSMIGTLEGGFAVVGNSSSGMNEENGYVLRTDCDGEKLWDLEFGGGSRDEFWDVTLDGEGGYAFTGYTYSFGEGGSDAWLIRTREDPVSVGGAFNPSQPIEIVLASAYPNPFNSQTILKYSSGGKTPVEYSLSDISGRMLRQGILPSRNRTGTFQINGEGLNAGMYFVSVKNGSETATVKLCLVK